MPRPCDPTPTTPCLTGSGAAQAPTARSPALALALTLVASLLAGTRRARQLHHAEVGRLPERRRDRRRSTRSCSTSRRWCSLIVEGALVYSLIKFRAKKGAVAAQIHGNTRLEIGWTFGSGADPRGPHRGHVRQAPSIINPPNSAPTGSRGAAALRLHDRADAAERQEAHDLRHRAAVHLALHLRRGLQGAIRSRASCPTPTRRWSYRRTRRSS